MSITFFQISRAFQVSRRRHPATNHHQLLHRARTTNLVCPLALSSSLLCSISVSPLHYFSSASSAASSPPSSLKVAIVGSGPSGCYTAKYLSSGLQKQHPTTQLTVDMLERLPTPYGLVRYGVAPDHPEVKQVQYDFDKVLFGTTTTVANGDDDKKNGGNERGTNRLMNFFGNVQVGVDVTLEELRKLYDIVILAYGCESDQTLKIPGGDPPLKGILSAREFVAWYNGHSDFTHVGDIVREALEAKKKKNISGNSSHHNHIVVIGQGNVALDCARILAKTRQALDDTDIATPALDVLHHSDHQNPRTISIIGRRGHVQGAFTIKELRELTKLHEEGTGCPLVVRPEELDLGLTDASLAEIKAHRPKKRMDKLLRDHTTRATATTESKDINGENNDDKSSVHIRFLLSPIRFESEDGGEDVGRLDRLICERTRLEGDADHQKAVGTGEMEPIQADLALVSIGYKGVAIPGTEDWFDKTRGVMKNDHGRVDPGTMSMMPTTTTNDRVAGLYVSGWLKRGPTGIIGTNINDAKDTVATILHDLEQNGTLQRLQENQNQDEGVADSNSSLTELLQQRKVAIVDWEGVQRIEAVEGSEDRKRTPHQLREKLTTRDDLLQAAGL